MHDPAVHSEHFTTQQSATGLSNGDKAFYARYEPNLYMKATFTLSLILKKRLEI
jgi:hypothetical protein